jgi:hypothetical protein
MPVVAFRGPVLPDRGPPLTRAGDWQARSISRPAAAPPPTRTLRGPCVRPAGTGGHTGAPTRPP